MSLIGTLREIRLADVLRLFASSKKTGLLTASAPGRQAVIRFQKGAVVHAAAGRLQGEDAVLDVFGWEEGQLTFVPEEKVVAPNVAHGVDVLILEGERQGHAFHRMNEMVPNDRVSFQFSEPASDEARYALGAREWKVLRLVDGVRDVRDLVEQSQLPRSDVLRVLYDLTQGGFVEKVDSQKTLRAQVQGGRFSKGDAADLDERLEQDWGKLARFGRGVLRIEVRTFARRGAVLPVAFRPGLARDVHLPRAVFGELGLREGEEVFVRPVA
ncbi:MAG TPA: DUF4388 domain-containing protein [Vicinamibacteria bacterium]|nr:DUF4388 domain-containing protein [Vicinamibacteria bacterium]